MSVLVKTYAELTGEPPPLGSSMETDFLDVSFGLKSLPPNIFQVKLSSHRVYLEL